jgi:hypothetical protein
MQLRGRTLHLCFLPVLALNTLDEPGVLGIVCSGLKIRDVTCKFKPPITSLHHFTQLVQRLTSDCCLVTAIIKRFLFTTTFDEYLGSVLAKYFRAQKSSQQQ